MLRSQRYFTCLACENDILITKMTQHYESLCQTIQQEKLDLICRKQNYGKSGSFSEKQKHPFQAKFKDKVQLNQPQIPNKDYLFNKRSPKIYNKQFIKQTIQPIKKYEQEKKNDVSSWQNLHKNTINSKYLQKNINKGIKWAQKSISHKNSQKQKAYAPRKPQLQQNRVQCVKCKCMIPFQNIDTHEFECSFQIQCQYCGQVTLVLNIQEHQKQCIIKKQLLKQQEGKYQQGEQCDYQPYYHQPSQENQYANDQSYEDQFVIHHHAEQDDDQQAQWQYYQGYSNPIPQHKYKGLTKSILNNLPLMCYKKKSHKSQIKKSQNNQNQQEQQKQQKQQKQQEQKNQQKQQKQQDQQQVCSICYLNFQQNQTIMKLKCLHYFHPQCVGKWFQNDDRCPLCKKNVI